MFKKIITVTMATGLMLMSSVGAFAATPATQDMLYDAELGYEVDLDNPSKDTLGCSYVKDLGYEVTPDQLLNVYNNIKIPGVYQIGSVACSQISLIIVMYSILLIPIAFMTYRAFSCVCIDDK